MRSKKFASLQERTTEKHKPETRNEKLKLARDRHAHFLWEHFADAFHLRAHAAKLFFDTFIAAIYVINAIDNRFAVGDKRRQNQRSRCAQVRCQNRSGTQLGFSANNCATSFNLDVRA